ncbi:hypothetical protein D3C81_1966730 [compost metagenome]
MALRDLQVREGQWGSREYRGLRAKRALQVTLEVRRALLALRVLLGHKGKPARKGLRAPLGRPDRLVIKEQQDLPV